MLSEVTARAAFAAAHRCAAPKPLAGTKRRLRRTITIGPAGTHRLYATESELLGLVPAKKRK